MPFFKVKCVSGYYKQKAYPPNSCGSSSVNTAKVTLIPVNISVVNAAPIAKPSDKLCIASPSNSDHATVLIPPSVSIWECPCEWL